jgi:Rrf2 family protein
MMIMLSQTGLYALQALLHLAGSEANGPVPASHVADELDIPRNYLAKVLQRLAHERILSATRGAHGGYRLDRDPSELTVATVIAPFQDLEVSSTCLMGGPCDLANPCPAHARRVEWNATALRSLERTTLADLLGGVHAGGKAATEPIHSTELES